MATLTAYPSRVPSSSATGSDRACADAGSKPLEETVFVRRMAPALRSTIRWKRMRSPTRSCVNRSSRSAADRLGENQSPASWKRPLACHGFAQSDAGPEVPTCIPSQPSFFLNTEPAHRFRLVEVAGRPVEPFGWKRRARGAAGGVLRHDTAPTHMSSWPSRRINRSNLPSSPPRPRGRLDAFRRSEALRLPRPV